MLFMLLNRLRRDAEGQSMTEYALILALIAVVVIGVLVTLGTDVKAVFNAISTEIAKVIP